MRLAVEVRVDDFHGDQDIRERAKSAAPVCRRQGGDGRFTDTVDIELRARSRGALPARRSHP